MSPKDKTITIRLTADLLARLDAAAALESKTTGYKISRNAFIETSIRVGIDQAMNDAGLIDEEFDEFAATLKQ